MRRKVEPQGLAVRGLLAAMGLVGGALGSSVHAQEVAAGSHLDSSHQTRSSLAPAAETSLGAESEYVDDGTEVAAEVTGTGILPALVTAGAIDPNGKVPVFNGVPGSGVPNADVSFPLTLLTHGVSYCVTINFQDFNVTGNYKVDYYITQVVDGATKKLVDQTIVTGQTTAPGDVFGWSIYTKAIPNSPGLATLVGRVRWGTNYSSQAIVSAKIMIQ